MKTYKVIKTEAEYEEALERIETLMAKAHPGTASGDELEVLSLLAENYEAQHHPVGPPTPIEAIKFRMEQQGLAPRDLIPYLGSKGRVSEVLSGKRPLTLSMIRALHVHLGIPAEVLLRPNEKLLEEPVGIDWSRYPVRELVERGWFPGVTWGRGVVAQAEDFMRLLSERAGGGEFCAPEAACFRAGHRENAKADQYALHAWVLCVKAKALADDQQKRVGRFEPGRLTKEFLQDIARLSVLENGPKVAVDMLTANGILFVYEKHFAKTYLDGAAMLLKDRIPVVGLTLRYDRIDHFWFCLLHELAHIMLHMGPGKDKQRLVLDDFDISAEGIEKEADTLAMEAMIPSAVWEDHPAARAGEVKAVRTLAKKLRIHPAIVAGRVRHEEKDYRMLAQLIGSGQVRKLFEDVA